MTISCIFLETHTVLHPSGVFSMRQELLPNGHRIGAEQAVQWAERTMTSLGPHVSTGVSILRSTETESTRFKIFLKLRHC